MDYKNVRPMIKKLGIKGEPVMVSTSSSVKKNDSQVVEDTLTEKNVVTNEQDIQQNTTTPIFEKDRFEQPLHEISSMEKDIQPTIQPLQNKEDDYDDSIVYRVGDIAKSFDHIEKKSKPSKRVVGSTIPEDVEKVDSIKRAQAEDSFNGIISSVKALKSLTQFDKPSKPSSIKVNKDERYQPMNPNAEKMIQLIEGNTHSTISFKPSTEPIVSKTGILQTLKTLEKQNEQRQRTSYKDYSPSGIRPLPFSEVDLRDFFTQDELQKPVKPLEPVPFKTFDLRKADQDDQTDFFNNNSTEKNNQPFSLVTPSTPVEKQKVSPVSQPNQYPFDYDDFSLKELDIKDDELYGEVIEQETVEKEEKKNFVSPDAKNVSRFAWLAYILFFIPLLINRKSAYVRHSANEGLEINFIDLLGIICILVGKFVTPSTLIVEGVLIGLMIMGSILLVLTTVTKVFMIVATLKGKYVSTPWFWNIEIIR